MIGGNKLNSVRYYVKIRYKNGHKFANWQQVGEEKMT
jgi:hypothetical protein